MAAYRSVFRTQLFMGQVAVVTGGGTGIGLQITRELLELGCTVVISSRNAQKLASAVEALRPVAAAGGGRVEYVVCNIRQEQQVDALFDRVLELCGRLDILVNNSGGQFPAPASMISLKGWSAVIETNLTGTFLCCKAAHAAWMGEHGGCIVNIIADMVSCAVPPPTPLPSQGFATDPPSFARPGILRNLTVEGVSNARFFLRRDLLLTPLPSRCTATSQLPGHVAHGSGARRSG